MAYEELKKKNAKAKGMSETDAVVASMKDDGGEGAEDTGMVSMKITKAETKAKSKSYPMAADSGERYPYGLQIRLDNDSMKKLGIELPEVGEEVMVCAKADVTEASANETSEGGKRLSCTLQITKLQIKG